MIAANTPFIWTPGVGPSQAAIDRIRSNVQMPKEPMGEAWFMGGERRMYTELLSPNAIAEMDITDLSMFLYEIGSGTHSFGHLREWDEWFAYLLPDLIERSVETVYFDKTIFQEVVTAFMAIFWNGIVPHYPQFREDVFASLSQTMMDKRFWSFDDQCPRPPASLPSPCRLPSS